jgi:hypothetical protein
MTYHRLCNNSNTTGVTSGAGIALPLFLVGRFLKIYSERRVCRYQRVNQNLSKKNTTQWPKEKVQKHKQRSQPSLLTDLEEMSNLFSPFDFYKCPEKNSFHMNIFFSRYILIYDYPLDLKIIWSSVNISYTNSEN